MPYPSKGPLPGETASKTGHLDIIRNPFIRRLVENFRKAPDSHAPAAGQDPWEPIVGPQGPGQELPIIFAIDGSLSTVASTSSPPRVLSFVKTVLLCLDAHRLATVDKRLPHPFQLREILTHAAVHHAVVLPLKNATLPGMTLYHCIRQIIYEGMRHDPYLQDEVLNTLKWLAYRKWSNLNRGLEPFACPHCREVVATLPYDADEGPCPRCGKHLFVTDWLGLHIEMDDSMGFAPEKIAKYYMNLHEILLLFTGIRYYWEKNPAVLHRAFFLKDGPLSLRAQYTKLVEPIRAFLAFAHDKGVPVHILGQEKTGFFADHLDLIGGTAPPNSLFIPNDDYINTHVFERPPGHTPYGYYHAFGSKVFLKFRERQHLAVSVPTRGFNTAPRRADFIGLENILATLPSLISHRHDCALYPVELAHGIASLSTYPSAHILRIFSDSATLA